MRYNDLGKTGLRVSALGCGTSRLKTHSREITRRVLNLALDRGINFISSGYGDMQEIVGEAVSHRRDEFYVSSKNGQPTAQGVQKGIEESLRMLKTDYIDIYEMDGIADDQELERLMAPGGALEGLVAAKEQGKIGHIGITSHRPDALAKAIRTGFFETALFICNIVQHHALDELVPLARELGVGTIGIRPISNAALKPVYKTLTYALICGVDVVLSGMCLPSEVEENVAIAEREVSPEEHRALIEEVVELESTGCRTCQGDPCRCPQGIQIAFLLPLMHYWRRYGLLPEANRYWLSEAGKANRCDDCGRCEEGCPFSVPIIESVHRIAHWLRECG